MDGFLRILGRVAQYRLARAVFVLALAAVAALVGTAEAHTLSNPTADGTQATAYQKALYFQHTNWHSCGTACNTATQPKPTDDAANKRFIWRVYYNTGTQYTSGGVNYTTSCVNGWDAASEMCAPDQTECLERNQQEGFANTGNVSKSFTSRCIAGCMYEMVGGGVVVTSPQGEAGSIVANGGFEWTGTCPVNAAPEETVEDAKPKPQECIAIADAAGSACVKSNGEHCHTASNGFQACWKPGETGEKTVGDVSQVKVAGPNEIPPSLNLPNGDTLTKQPPSVTTNTTNTTTNRTTTTTTTNYVTTHGTNPPGTNVGEPLDGTGGTTSGDGDKPSTATGGANCAESDKPVAVGDAILSNLLEQAWRTRCAVESGNSVTTTGGAIDDCKTAWAVSGPEKSVEVLKLKALRKQICGNVATATGDIGDCAQPFTLAGDPESAQFHQLKAMRLSTCGVQAGDEFSSGTWAGEDTDNTGFGTADEGAEIGGDGLDAGGYGYGSSCPTIPSFSVMGQTVSIDTGPLCSFAEMLGLLILIFASLASIRIMTSSGA